MTADAVALPSPHPLDAGARSAWRTLLRGPVVLGVVVDSILRIALRRVRPFFAVVSPVGGLVLLLGLGSLGVSAVLGWVEFFFLGATTLAALLVSVAFIFGRSTYAVRIELNPRRVVVGEKALGSITTTNTGRKRVLATRMELPIGAGAAEFTLPQLAPGEVNEELFTVPTNRRAVIVAGPAVSVRGDQLGLLRRTVRWTEPLDLFVHPLTTRLASSAAGLVRDLEGQVTKKVTNSDISFHALRSYVPGDDRRYVHWRTSARTGQLMVRQFEETRRSQLIVIHSADHRYYASDDEFELAVSVTASIALQVIRDGTQLNVVSERRTLRTHSATAMLDDSCRLSPVGKAFDSARSFAREVTRRLPAPSVVMVVGGSKMTTAEMRGIKSLFPVDTTVVGIRVEAGGHPRFSTVAGLRVLAVGQLSDLPKLLRRAA